MLKGHCACGFVRYEAGGTPSNGTNCHCSICRRTSAAPFVAWFTVALNQFRIVSGEPARFSSSESAERSFCPRCGTPLTFYSRHSADQIDVTTCSLEDPELVPPADHTYIRSQLSWVRLADELPRYPKARTRS